MTLLLYKNLVLYYIDKAVTTIFNFCSLLMEMVKLREEKKRDLLKTTMKILETRFASLFCNGKLKSNVFVCFV